MFCPHCGKETSEDQMFCQYCGSRLIADADTSAPAGQREKTSWEDREHNGFLNGLFRTIKAVLFSPTVFFRKMPVSGGLIDPLLYGLIVGMIGLTFLYFWDALLQNTMQDFITPEMRSAAGQSIFQGIGMALTASLMPLFLILWLFIVSGMVHLLLLFVRGAQAGFEATFRVAAYSTSPLLFLIIPYCGMLITMVWVITLALIGLKEAHEISGGKSAFAVFFPFLFCCGLLVLLVLLFMGAVAASLGTMMHLYK